MIMIRGILFILALWAYYNKSILVSCSVYPLFPAIPSWYNDDINPKSVDCMVCENIVKSICVSVTEQLRYETQFQGVREYLVTNEVEKRPICSAHHWEHITDFYEKMDVHSLLEKCKLFMDTHSDTLLDELPKYAETPKEGVSRVCAKLMVCTEVELSDGSDMIPLKIKTGERAMKYLDFIERDHPEYVKQPSDIYVKSIRKSGSGKKPTSLKSTVVVYYAGYIAGNVLFQDSYGGEPHTFSVDRVIPGWQQAIMNMEEGDEIQVIIPPHLGYGSRGTGGIIGSNEVLHFNVHLVEVKSEAKEDGDISQDGSSDGDEDDL